MPAIAGRIEPNTSHIFNEYGEKVLGCYWSEEFVVRCDFCVNTIQKLRCDQWRQSNVDYTILCKDCVEAYL